ncbi:P-loop NTPase fold protein [Janthinobacterium sp. Mn2066]|uniref:P-loop NTPase fold protein n=1 Tax=Janthinobacterium sp. Mn2066 TaxID=3395264 RepID=UPI003BEA421E
MQTEIISNEKTNQALEDYLIRYCTRNIPPYFSVLIEGPWGSGKTWFINCLREKLNNIHKKRCLYVSLYGAKQTSDITDQFFQQLHPRLASEGVQRSWSILKSMVKVSLRMDLDFDQDRDTLNVSLPELGKMASPEGSILIFDDFERCGIPPSEVLGFINQFVEHEGYRVLILANESKIENGDKKFEEIKEKVIGRSFRIKPQTKQAIDSFIDELVNDDSIEVLKTRKKLILDVERRGKHNNLRLVRQAVLDFSDIWSCLPVEKEELKKNLDFLDRLVLDVFSFSIEYRAGTIKPEHILKLENGGFLFSQIKSDCNKTSTDPSDFDKARERISVHKLTESWEFALSPATYFAFFSQGHLSHHEAADGIAYSRYFITDQNPVWHQLWYRRKLDDESFTRLSAEALDKLSCLQYSEWGELFHIVGILLNLAEKKLINYSIDEIFSIAKDVVDRLATQKRINFGNRKSESRGYFDKESAFNHGFIGIKIPQFQKFIEYYDDALRKGRHEALFEWANEWMEELNTNVKLWSSRINPKSEVDALYANQAIFCYINPSTMTKSIINSQSNTINEINQALQYRYGRLNTINQWQLEELSFWQECLAEIETILQSRDKKLLSTFHLNENLVPTIKNIVRKLEELKQKISH